MVQNIPTWVIWAVGISSILQVLLLLLLIVGLVLVGSKLVGLVGTVSALAERVNGKIIDNVERMSDDAANTTHNVTSAVNRVSNLVGSAANRMESPLIRAVGMASGVVAAARSMRGRREKTEVIVQKRKKGFLG